MGPPLPSPTPMDSSKVMPARPAQFVSTPEFESPSAASMTLRLEGGMLFKVAFGVEPRGSELAGGISELYTVIRPIAMQAAASSHAAVHCKVICSPLDCPDFCGAEKKINMVAEA